MRVQYDTQADALYIELRPLEPGTAQARDLTNEITADYGPDGTLAGIEILDASKCLGRDELKRIVLEVTPITAV